MKLFAKSIIRKKEHDSGLHLLFEFTCPKRYRKIKYPGRHRIVPSVFLRPSASKGQLGLTHEALMAENKGRRT
jgi:hypothetical protein